MEHLTGMVIINYLL